MDDVVGFPPKIMYSFVETLSASLEYDAFSAVLDKAGLPIEWANAAHFSALTASQSAEAYSKLQAAVRTYYGRGARGILFRIGGKLWQGLLNDATFGVKAQAAMLRGLPTGLRRKRALDLLSRLLSVKPGDNTVHTLDLDLLFIDHTSPTTLAQSDSTPICFVTLGMIRECLYWAVGYEHDIEETLCRAKGAKNCEFRIIVGG